MQDVYILGSYSTRFQRWPDKSYKDLARDAYLGVLADAGLENGDDIEFGWFGNCAMGVMAEQHNIRGQVCFVEMVDEGLFPARAPMINVEGACATASMALHGAWKDVLAGQTQLSLAIGVEKQYMPDDPEKTMASFMGGIDNFDKERLFAEYEKAAKEAGKDWGTGGDRTVFMDTYATQAAWHMWKHGTTQEQIAVGAAKNHNFGAENDKAQYQFRMTPEMVLEDRPVSYPLTRSMCAPIGDGAAAALICSEDYLKAQPKAVQERAIKIRTSVLTGGKYRKFDEPGLSMEAAKRAYAATGLKPSDMHVAEVHDATSFCEILQMEMLGFCEPGEGGKFVGDGQTMLSGKIPTNTGGGLVSKGHPVGATGLSMVYELSTQLRGEAGKRQVEGAHYAIQENGGGVIGFEEAACSVMILEGPKG